MAYNGHNGVKYRRYELNEEEERYEEPEFEETDAVLDELHFESYSGTLDVTVDTGEGYVSISIPVKATHPWNEFLQSLPEWDQ